MERLSPLAIAPAASLPPTRSKLSVLRPWRFVKRRHLGHFLWSKWHLHELLATAPVMRLAIGEKQPLYRDCQTPHHDELPLT